MQPANVTGCRYANADGTAIDCTVTFVLSEGVTETWPFTATPDDIVATGRDIFARAVAGEFGAIEPYVAPEPLPPAPIVITNRQLFAALALTGLITEAEALAAGRAGEVPAAIDAIFSALPDPQQTFLARLTWATMREVPRDHPLIAAMIAAELATAEQVDGMFALGASL